MAVSPWESPLVFALMVLLLLPFVHSDVAWYDGAHLSAAAAGLGVPHPTGFPLFCISGYGASLAPLGSLPFRVALTSALYTAGAATLLYRLLRRESVGRWPAALGPILLTTNLAVFVNGTLAEVYTMTLFWLAAFATLITQNPPNLRRTALLMGLGMGAHVTAWLTGLVGWLLLMGSRRVALRDVIGSLPVGIFGAAIVIYIPLAAGRDPVVNWDAPTGLSGLWAHLSAASIREAFAGEILTGGGWTTHLKSWLEAAGGPLWPGLIGLAAFGGWAARQRTLWLAGLTLLVVDLFYATLINPMGLAELQNGTPGALALAMLCPLGIQGLGLRLGRLAEVGAGLATGLALVVGFSLGFDQRSPDDLAGRYGRLALADVAPDALVFTASDHLSGLGWYLTGVEGFRPDVHTKVGQFQPDAVTMARERALTQPVYWQLGNGALDRQIRSQLDARGWLNRVALSGPSEASEGGDAFDDIAALAKGVRHPGWRSRLVFSEHARLRAVHALTTGRLQQGAALAEASVKLDPRNPRGLLTQAVSLARRGQVREAAVVLERAVELAPAYAKAWKNLASFRDLLKDADGAEVARRRWRELMGSR